MYFLDNRLILMLMIFLSFSATNWVSTGWGPVPAVIMKCWSNYSIKLKEDQKWSSFMWLFARVLRCMKYLADSELRGSTWPLNQLGLVSVQLGQLGLFIFPFVECSNCVIILNLLV